MPCIGGTWVFSQASQELLNQTNKILESQKHRDQEAVPLVFYEKQCCLGMINRYNGIWAPATQQDCEFRGIRAVIDGIVLDWSKVRAELAACDVPIEKASCAQMVAAAYLVWGLHFMHHLEGEFSCAIWDEAQKRLILARDPYGTKALHYYYDREKCLFSSEIKGLLAAGLPAEVDRQSLSDYLSLDNIPTPGTMFKNIYQVSPGKMMIFTASASREECYWSPLFPTIHAIKEEEAIEELSAKLRTAVKRRILGNQTYSFLSGGLDSSTVVAFATQVQNAPLHTISIGFEEDQFNELPYAAEMARHAQSIHHQMVCRPDSFFDILETLIRHHDLPFSDTSACPTFFAAKLAREHTDLILTGDGPDQLLGSANHLYAVQSGLFSNKRTLRRKTSRILSQLMESFMRYWGAPKPSLITKVYRRSFREGQPPASAYFDMRAYIPEIVKLHLITPELRALHLQKHPYRFCEKWFKESSTLDPLGQMLYADMIFFVTDDLMIKVDRMSRAHGLETLMPFFDRELSRFLISLPSQLRLKVVDKKNILQKYILRKVAEKNLPEMLLKKSKQGFAIPIDSWLRKDNAKFLREILLDKRTLSRGYFKEQAIRELVDDYIAEKCDYHYANPMAFVMLLNLEIWHRLYID